MWLQIAYTRACSRNIWVEADWKALFILDRAGKCQRKRNSIYGWKRNKNKHSFSAEKNENESHLIGLILVFFLFIHSVTKSALRRQYLVQFRFFCRWSLLTGFHFPQVLYIDTLCHFASWHFNPWTVCFPDLLLPIESSFPQCMHCA